jgi:hypothetical protein
MARLATLPRDKLSDDDLALMQTRLADTTLPEGPRATLLFGLAHALDSRKRYDLAAAFLNECNAVNLAGLVKKRQGYQPSGHERFVSSIIGAFGPDLFTRLAGCGSPSRRPVFVLGLPRSGTTLIEQVLSSHSQVHGAGELLLGRRDFEAIPAQLDRPGELPIACFDDPRIGTVLREIAERHDARLAELGGQAARVTDKMPDNYMYIGLLSILFPHAAFIHCRRNLRDVAVSCWMTNFRSIRWANDPEHIGRRFTQYLRPMDHWRAVLPGRLCEVAYEEAVDDLETVARRIIAACGLE